MLLVIFLIAYFAANSVDAMEAPVTLCFLVKEGQIIFERLKHRAFNLIHSLLGKSSSSILVG